MDQDNRFPSTDYSQVWDSQEKSSTDDAPVCETRKRKLECACSGLVLHKINDYLQ